MNNYPNYLSRNYYLRIIGLCILLTIGLTTRGQNTGPNAPEAQGFEPIDASNMVNLQTGDFNYVLPLLEVPGPEAGFPVVLSYHAGIGPDLEASWVGLGWNVNVGAINRNVNMFPDDVKNMSILTTLHDDGGSQSGTYYDLDIPIPYTPLSVNFNWGTNKSLGVNVTASVGEKGVGASLTIGTDGASIGIGAVAGKSLGGGFNLNAGAGIGLGINSDGSPSIGGGVSSSISYYSPANKNGGRFIQSMSQSISSLGISLSTSGVGISGSIIDYSNNGISNSKDNYQISTSTKTIPIIPFVFQMTKQKTRWYLHEESEDIGYGILYSMDARKDYSANSESDCQSPKYSMDVVQTDWGINNPNNLSAENSLMSPGYDQYIIEVQGIGGSMSPKLFQNAILLGNGIYNYENEYNSYYYERSTDDLSLEYNKIHFYMDGVYESYLRNYPGKYDISNPDNPLYNGNTVKDTVVNGKSYTTYNDITGRKSSGTYVEWIRNSDIVNENTGNTDFIETDCIRDQRGNKDLFDSDGIGAINITTIDGKVYHFSLPVYQFEQFGRDERDFKNGAYADFFDQQKVNKYAYTWLLTSITGPDYIDANGNGDVDENDYGYWVKLDYGKWTDGYIWSLPYSDSYNTYEIDKDKHRQFTWGRKQIYYLNSIKTATHTAYFIKSLREDGLGSKEMNYMSGTWGHYLGEVPIPIIDETWTQTDSESPWRCDCGLYSTPAYGATTYRTIKTFPKHKVLKLDRIILVKNADANLSTKNLSNLISNPNAYGGKIEIKETAYMKKCISNIDFNGCGELQKKSYEKVYINSTFYINYQDNVLDIADLPNNFNEKALKVIEFGYDQNKDGIDDYTLCKNSPNSDAGGKGKLTLHSVQFKGKNGFVYLPAYNFDYNKKDLSRPSEDQIDDWGFYANNSYSKTQYDDVNKDNADAWSLSEITTPTGSKIKINYESDSYSREAFGSLKTYFYQRGWITSYDTYSNFANIVVQFPSTVNINLDKAFTIGKTYPLLAEMTVCNYIEMHSNCGECTDCSVTQSAHKLNYHDYYPVKAIDVVNRKVTFEVPIDPEVVGTQHVMNDNFFAVTTDPYSTSYGGGIRVKSIVLTDENLNTSTSGYDYNIPGTNETSGITSYAPINTQNRQLPYLPFLPPPGVFYNYVTVSTIDSRNITQAKAAYEFETLTPFQVPFDDYTKTHNNNVIEINWLQKENGISSSNQKSSYASIIVKNTNFYIGRLKTLSLFNSQNQLISITSYNYLPKEKSGQGVIQETFRYIRVDENKAFGKVKYLTSTSQTIYPNVLESTESRTNGLRSIKRFMNWDFLTGALLKESSTLANGKKYQSSSEKAYNYYTEMGPKCENPAYRNMLTQEAAGYDYEERDGDLIPLAVKAQTWNDEWIYRELKQSYYDQPSGDVPSGQKVWRKHQSYVWKGELNPDGSLKDFSDTKKFNFKESDAFNLNNGWVNTGEITRYNHYSIPLESKDINGNYVATKLDKDNQVIATATNVNYNSFAYSSFENISGKEWGGEYLSSSGCSQMDGINSIPAHTGNYYCSVSGTMGPIFTSVVSDANDGMLEGRSYKAQVWMYQTTPEASVLVLVAKDGSGNEIKRIEKRKDATDNQSFGDWTLVTVILDKSYLVSGYTISSFVYTATPSSVTPMIIDDQRIQPIDATVTAYVYDYVGNLKAILDNNNFAAKFDYDDAGRLIRTWKETPAGFRKLSENKYNFKMGKFRTIYCSPESFKINQLITLTAENAGIGATYAWDFGDGTVLAASANNRSVTHTYTTLQVSIPVKLTIVDAEKRTEEVTRTLEPNYIQFTNPKTGSAYSPGSLCTIYWSSNIEGTFTIEYFHPVSSTYYTLKRDATAGELYQWSIPSDISLISGYKIRITNNETQISAESGLFEIKQETPPPVDPPGSEMEIVKPSADEVISKSERNYLIQWNGYSGNVKIVAQPTFGTYTPITIVADHSGSGYTWDVSNFNLSAGNYYLIISSTDGTISKSQKISIQ